MIANDRITMQKQVYNFLRSLTIKFEPMAYYLNETVASMGYAVNDLDPTSWKYYLNMQGKYHAVDTPMYVTSLDTQERILFSPEILVNHPRTKTVYMPGGLYYKRLCSLYPHQVDLIKSILFPVEDIDTAIRSADFTLLKYGEGYLEPWEEAPLVSEVIRYLGIYKERWYFDFLDDEPYFHIATWGSLYTQLAMLIMTTRESFVHTPYVHTFHLWSHLVSCGLDDYSDILNREKSMFLYQNIDYLRANAGKHGNLIILANNLLLDYGVSIYGRKVLQEAETNASSYQLVPQLAPVRVPLDNDAITSEIASESVTVIQNQVFAKGLTTENTAEASAAKERRLGDTTLNEFSSKFLEIRPLTKNKVYADILNVFILETLTTSITQGYYNKPVSVTDLSTGAAFYMYPAQLLALYHYACQKAIGNTPEKIPTKFFFYKSFLPQIRPQTLKKLKRGDDLIYISLYVDAPAFLSDLHYDTDMADPDAFSDMLTRQWLKYVEHMVMDQSTKIDRVHTILEYLSSLCHERRIEEHELVPGFTDYDKWLGPEGIDIMGSMLAQYDSSANPLLAWEQLADSIITALVPINDTLSFFGNFTLSDFGYQRLRQLFIQMCSYRVVFLESSRETPEYLLGGKLSTDYGDLKVHIERDHCTLRDVRYVQKVTRRATYAQPICVPMSSEVNVTQGGTYTVIHNTQVGPIQAYAEREHIQIRRLLVDGRKSVGTLTMTRQGMSVEGLSS